MDCVGLPAYAGAAHTPAAALPFSPIRLIGVVVVFYLFVYCVQRVEFSPLVPKKYRAAANITTLLTGPLLLIVLFVAEAVRKSSERQESFLQTFRNQIVHMVNKWKAGRAAAAEDESALRLLDSAGRTLDEIYGHGDVKKADSRTLDLTEKMIADALERRASDLLIDPKDEASYTVRLRIDGVLRIVKEFDADTCRAVMNSIKAVAGMDISEKRRPQDGGFMARRAGITSSFRVASAGVLHGEKLAIRVLNEDAGSFTLAEVGFAGGQLDTIGKALKKPNGMILICGPTGSGKTTTMYAMLNEIDRFTRNVITVEDPIEAVLPQASQIEINPKADITFAKTLRSMLRQDPDVICVGEIRDEETAEIALRASQTGHLVLATIHCDSNATAMVRLLDLGISPLLLASGLSLVGSQRLLRKLCPRCKKPAHLSDSQIAQFDRKGIAHDGVCETHGCRHCEGTGYFGRTAVCDLLVITDQLKADIASSRSLVNTLKTDDEKKARSNLRRHAMKKVVAGVTSLEEIKRVIG